MRLSVTVKERNPGSRDAIYLSGRRQRRRRSIPPCTCRAEPKSPATQLWRLYPYGSIVDSAQALPVLDLGAMTDAR